MANTTEANPVTVAPGSTEEVYISREEEPPGEVALQFDAEWVGVPTENIAVNIHADEEPVTREVLEPGEVAVWGSLVPGVSVAVTRDDDTLDMTFTLSNGTDAYSQHLRDRGALPELAPPAEGRHSGDKPSPSVPRALDRRIPDDEIPNLLDTLAAEPWGYAITFPEADAPPTYIRAHGGSDRVKKVLGRFAERNGAEWGVDQPFVGVRQDRASGEWDRRDYSTDAVAQRVRRSPAVRLVHHEDAPGALYPDGQP